MIFIKSRENYAKYVNLRKIPWDYRKIGELTQNPVRITQNPVRIMQNMRTYAKSRENYGKISKLTQNPVRITQNMRTYAKSRENYAKYMNLRKIPWELPFYPTKIFFLPIRILQNIQKKLFIPEIPPCAKISHISYRKKYPASCKSYRKLRFYAGNFRLPAAYVEPWRYLIEASSELCSKSTF